LIHCSGLNYTSDALRELHLARSQTDRPRRPLGSGVEEAQSTARFDAFDVVVVPFPYADRLAEKRRPALVISNRKLAVSGLIWVAMITSADNESWPSDVGIGDLKRAGLPGPSVIRPAKIACIDPARILRRAGRVDKATAKTVAQKLRGFLGVG
jgi:mRNA interferase MazF